MTALLKRLRTSLNARRIERLQVRRAFLLGKLKEMQRQMTWMKSAPGTFLDRMANMAGEIEAMDVMINEMKGRA